MKETPQQMFLRLLIEGKVSFQELSEAYTWYLEKKNKDRWNVINGLASVLSEYWHGKPIRKSRKEYLRSKGAHFMLQSQVFHTALYEKDLEKFVKESPYEDPFEEVL